MARPGSARGPFGEPCPQNAVTALESAETSKKGAQAHASFRRVEFSGAKRAPAGPRLQLLGCTAALGFSHTKERAHPRGLKAGVGSIVKRTWLLARHVHEIGWA